jgi:hypothetical protein
VAGSGSKDDKAGPTRLNDMIAGRPNAHVGYVPGRKRRTESGEEDVETGEEVALDAEEDQERTNGLYVNASPFAAFKPADTTAATTEKKTDED